MWNAVWIMKTEIQFKACNSLYFLINSSSLLPAFITKVMSFRWENRRNWEICLFHQLRWSESPADRKSSWNDGNKTSHTKKSNCCKFSLEIAKLFESWKIYSRSPSTRNERIERRRKSWIHTTFPQSYKKYLRKHQQKSENMKILRFSRQNREIRKLEIFLLWPTLSFLMNSVD